MPQPWKKRDARIDTRFGLKAHHMHEMNICATSTTDITTLDNPSLTRSDETKYTIRCPNFTANTFCKILC